MGQKASEPGPLPHVHSGVLLIRVWTEGADEGEPLKARVIGSYGTHTQTEPGYAVGIEAVLGKARQWLVEFQHHAPTG